MQQPPRREDSRGSSDPQDTARLKAAMRKRGWLKLLFVTLAANQVLTTAFVYVAQQVDPGLTAMHTLIFSCVTCALVRYWLQTDARRAWCNALDKGYIGSRHAESDADLLKTADNCPKRWLVVLHIELNPDLATTV
ncbi:hypothetical protein [Paraburkholderia sp. DGU8]|uniref:hypothetical protein n=1 Tax=Paraburkholderia sp. DGU8 TaxID=3161997 RepID=UPI003466046D